MLTRKDCIQDLNPVLVLTLAHGLLWKAERQSVEAYPGSWLGPPSPSPQTISHFLTVLNDMTRVGGLVEVEELDLWVVRFCLGGMGLRINPDHPNKQSGIGQRTPLAQEALESDVAEQWVEELNREHSPSENQRTLSPKHWRFMVLTHLIVILHIDSNHIHTRVIRGLICGLSVQF